MGQRTIVVIIGTRPEGIKLIPLYLALQQTGHRVMLCATFQHFELLERVCAIFGVTPDFRLDVMKKDQDLFYLTATVLERTRDVFRQTQPALVVVQGDTTTTMASALSAFYLGIPIAHVEAGLRTGNMRIPFPEEMNRRVVGQIATYHFAPTAFSAANLLAEGIDRARVFCTGNPVVDALILVRERIDRGFISIGNAVRSAVHRAQSEQKKLILLTAHRRESFGAGLERVFTAMRDFAQMNDDLLIVYPEHPNPEVARALQASAFGGERIVHMPSLNYADMVYLLDHVHFVVTDSGGLQEEAVSLGRRVVCLRDITERWEGVWEGTEVLTGTDYHRIVRACQEMLIMSPLQEKSAIYGDGNAVKRIMNILVSKLDLHEPLREHKSPVMPYSLMQRES